MKMKGSRKPNLAFLLIIAVSTLIAAGPGLNKGVLANVDQESGGAAGVPTLDFETYRTRVEPIFLKQRQDGVRCYDCHSVLSTRLRLQPLSPGSSSWTQEQSHQNFETVLKLVTPSKPLKSRLLLHPLAQEAGGEPTPTGGKFWASQNDPKWKMLAHWGGLGTEAPAPASPDTASPTYSAPDVQIYKNPVETSFFTY